MTNLLLFALTLAATNPSTTCDQPNVAATTALAATPKTPDVAADYHLAGTTWVQIDLTADGQLAGASIAKSSGYGVLDNAALAAAAASTFQPAVDDCHPVAGSYLFEVDFPA